MSNSNYFENTIIITVGDESGVGPEIILKALASNQIPQNIKIKIVGSKRNLIDTYKSLKLIGRKNIANPDELDIENIEVPKIDNANIRTNCGNSSFIYLKRAIEIVKSKKNIALVTGPICKKSWALAGHNYSGQTEVLAESFNTKNVGMLFTAKSPITGWRFNTLLTTTHIPLNEISKNLTESKDLIISKLNLLYEFSKQFKNPPTLRVAGLNPHAGEEGILGLEEKNFIETYLKMWSENNPEVKLEGPISPDSCWISSVKAWKENKSYGHDGILAMYHDQGLIPMKIIAFNYSVNTTIGLPIIRTSPDHGTGFDIFNKGIAQCQSILEAIKTANELCTKSRLFNAH
tara:strand:+ start:887 stop:1927 length:1041 start_codon:yes stop_codon:yes gene_type:complete